MNLFLLGITIFVIVYLFLNWFAKTSSKKIATTIKKIAIYISLILAVLFTIGGKFIFSLPMWLILLSGLKIKGASNPLFRICTSGSFSAISTPIFASKYSCSAFFEI